MQHHQEALGPEGQGINLVDPAPQAAEAHLALARRAAFERLACDPIQRYRAEGRDEAHARKVLRGSFREAGGSGAGARDAQAPIGDDQEVAPRPAQQDVEDRGRLIGRRGFWRPGCRGLVDARGVGSNHHAAPGGAKAYPTPRTVRK